MTNLSAKKLVSRVFLALGIALSATGAQIANAAETIKFAIVADPAFEAATWAMANGKVKDPAIDVQITPLTIPALLQAVATKQFDVLPAGVLQVPQMAESGLNTQIMATMIRYVPDGHSADIWVLKDSPIKTLADLKGKTIAVASLEAQYVVSVRAVVSEKYGLNVNPVGGDFKWAEIPPAQFEAAIKAGRVDAIVFANLSAYTAGTRGLYRSVLHGSKDLEALYGGPMASTLMTAYADDLKKRPAAYLAFARLAKASAAYALANQEEVFNAVAPKYKVEAKDLRGYFVEYAAMPFALGKSDKQVFVKSWQSGQKLGILKTVPASVDSLVWSQAVAE